MRFITRSDFDGLACGVLLKEAGIIDNYAFVHPKDLQDGLIEVDENDCLANVPFAEGCGLWFDHHSSEMDRKNYEGKFKGVSAYAPSTAHLIYDYYGGAKKFPNLFELLKAVDKLDSALLTSEEVLNPTGWTLLGFIMDPRTGLGRHKNFTISNYQLMENLIDWCRTLNIEEILQLPDVKERIDFYFEQKEKFIEMLKQHTKIYNNLIITDLRDISPIYCGNRFIIYTLYPKQNISVWIVSGKHGEGCSVAVGHNILNPTSKINVAKLMVKYNGGGHDSVGTCQFSTDTMTKKVASLLNEIIELSNN